MYTYVGFPLLVLVRGLTRSRPFLTADVTPYVSVLIAAHNEALIIETKILNLLQLDYPSDRLQIVIASDGSNDGTEEIVRRYARKGVSLLALPRRGKAETLNAAARVATAEILVFSDANSMYAPNSLRALVRPFADPAVGGVAGNQIYSVADRVDGSSIGEQQYWDLDRLLKISLSRAGSVTGATGAIYAIRREFFSEIPRGVNDDFMTSLRVVARKRRLVFASDAVAYEAVAESVSAEFGRKWRVMVRGLRCVYLMRELLDPRRYGFFSLQLFSHKVLARTMVVPLVTTAVTAPRLARRGGLYRAAMAVQATVYTLGAVGLLMAERRVGRRRVLALPAYFCLVNLASLRAGWSLLRGETLDRWEPRRAADSPQSEEKRISRPA